MRYNLKKMIRIIIADDHQVIIDGLKSMLREEEDIEVIAEANDGQKVLDILGRQQPDVLLLDVNMPKMNGIETTKQIQKKHPDCRVLILTMYNKTEFIRNLIAVGASGYVLKNTGREELLYAIRKVAGGADFYDTEVTKTIMSSLRPGSIDYPVQLTNR